MGADGSPGKRQPLGVRQPRGADEQVEAPLERDAVGPAVVAHEPRELHDRQAPRDPLERHVPQADARPRAAERAPAHSTS